jgi:hypothetical protein
MRRAARDIAVLLLAFVVVASAKPASVCETVGLNCPPKQSEMSASFGHSKDAIKVSFTQGRQTWPVKQISSFPAYPCVVEFAGCDTDFSLLPDIRPRLFSSSLYFSSLCNKAPPVA